jgi:Na+-transporting methylmalonyl-CoA/oxaloacetate decarboxylase gamma subunit
LIDAVFSLHVFHEEEDVMDNVTFGITMLVCGMGGTIFVLWIMSLVMGLLGKLFPEKPEKKEA